MASSQSMLDRCLKPPFVVADCAPAKRLEPAAGRHPAAPGTWVTSWEAYWAEPLQALAVVPRPARLVGLAIF